MCRKFCGGLVMLGVGAYLLTGTSLGSYVRTAYTQTVGYCKGQIPIEFQIDRAKQLIAELDPEIQRAARDIAVEEVRVSRLKSDIAKAQSELDEQQVAIMSIRQQIKKGLTSYQIGHRQYSPADLERDLARRFRSFKVAHETVKQRMELLSARDTKLVAARDTYGELIATKKELEQEIEGLDSEQKVLEAKKLAKRIVIDEGRFNEARKAIDEIRERLAVDQKLIEHEGYMVDPIPVEELPPANLTDEIDAFFGQPESAGTST